MKSRSVGVHLLIGKEYPLLQLIKQEAVHLLEGKEF